MDERQKVLILIAERSQMAEDDVSRLFGYLQTPPQPIHLQRVLNQFVEAVQCVTKTVEHCDEDTLWRLADMARRASMALHDDVAENLTDPSSETSDLRPYYTPHPVYTALERGHARAHHVQEYYWLLGLLLLAQAAASDDPRIGQRMDKWGMAVRAYGEPTTENDDVESLLGALTPIIIHGEDPAVALQRLRRRADAPRRRAHARYLLAAWHAVSGQAVFRRWYPREHHAGGYRPIRGVPAGHYAKAAPQTRHLRGLDAGADWATVERIADQQQVDGPGRAGEAPGEAGTPGDVHLPTESDAVTHYTRGAMYLAARRRQVRIANQGQDTLISIRPYTARQSACLIRELTQMCADDDLPNSVRAGAKRLLLCALSGLDEEALSGVAMVEDESSLPESGARFALIGEHHIAWKPQRPTNALRTVGRHAQPYVLPTSPWVVIPMPRLVRDFVPNLPSAEAKPETVDSPEPDSASALARLRTSTGIDVTWNRLRWNWWGWVTRATGQPVIATSMTGFVRPSTSVPRYYLHVTRLYQRNVYQESYQQFIAAIRDEFLHAGWTWCDHWEEIAESEPSADAPGAGSPIVPTHSALRRQLPLHVEKVGDGLTHLRARADQCALIIYAVSTLMLGLRAVHARGGYADLAARGMRTISDKDDGLYRKARFLPLPDDLSKMLAEVHRDRIQNLLQAGILAQQSGAPSPSIPQDRETLLQTLSDSPHTAISFSGFGSTHKLHQLSPMEIRTHKEADMPLPLNWNRHWIRTELAHRGVPDQVANAAMGHACIAQDPWGQDSCMRTSAHVLSATEHLAAVVVPIIDAMKSARCK